MLSHGNFILKGRRYIMFYPVKHNGSFILSRCPWVSYYSVGKRFFAGGINQPVIVLETSYVFF
jgi:hypothetical protein